MPFDLQNVIALACVAAAGIYLLWRGVRLLQGKRSGGCGPCGGCSATNSDAKPIVTVESLREKRTT